MSRLSNENSRMMLWPSEWLRVLLRPVQGRCIFMPFNKNWISGHQCFALLNRVQLWFKPCLNMFINLWLCRDKDETAFTSVKNNCDKNVHAILLSKTWRFLGRKICQIWTSMLSYWASVLVMDWPLETPGLSKRWFICVLYMTALHKRLMTSFVVISHIWSSMMKRGGWAVSW